MAFSESDMADLRSTLALHGQEHLLAFWNELSGNQKRHLYKDIKSVDFESHLSCFDRCMQKESSMPGVEEDLKPLPSDAFESVFHSEIDNDRWRKLGLKEISEGRVGLLLMAGGQGTRLGVSYPKGMYKVGLQSGKSLYQLQAERVCKQEKLAAEMYGSSKSIRWYIMTSEHTKSSTMDYFKANNWFGLCKENVIFFEQEMIPCVSLGGKIIMDSDHSLARAPGGNGDLYRAMGNEGILKDMLDHNIRSVHCYCVDNILVKIPDPLFIGCCLERNSDCGAKVVSKSHPTEAVGVICKSNDNWKVVEYSEISSETAHMTDANGKLLFSQGNICNHYFTTDFLSQVINKNEKELIHHVAKKKIPTISSTGEKIVPESINGIKMEKFVFDVFQFSKSFTVLEVARGDEFSPLKNGPGAAKCSPETCLEDLSNLHKRWILNAGGQLKNENDVCEVSPLVSADGESLEDIVGNKTIILPQHIDVTVKNGYHNGHSNGLYSKL